MYIANDATIELQKATGKNGDGESSLQTTDYWVARILEVRASDELHVYARIYWMYSPDELPPGTSDGKKMIAGRQPYHGQNELIASNHSKHNFTPLLGSQCWPLAADLDPQWT